MADAFPDDPLGAFCRINHAALSGSGRGPLAGLTFGVKDLFHIAGARTGFGQPDWLRTHEAATVTAVAVRLLLDAGADMVGKTHTDELAYSLSGENIHYGTPVNPRDPRRVPGGSSNGSASAVAGGTVDFALGSDCGGSVRLPASYCGILGIRPSHGRVSLQGAIPFGPSFDVAGWFARDPTILERVGRVLLRDEAELPPPRRLLVARDAFEMVDPRVSEALAPAVEMSARVCGATENVVVSAEGLRAWMEVFRIVQASEVWANLGAWVMAAKPRLGPGIKERFAQAREIAADTVLVKRSRTRWQEIRRALDQLFMPGDILCLPTSPRVAPLKGTPTDTIEIEYRYQAMCLLCISGLGGLPQVSLPLGELDGLPLGLSLVGPRGADAQLLRFARTLIEDHI